MGMKYTGIKIYKEVIIVAKNKNYSYYDSEKRSYVETDYPQAYVVEKGNTKMLASAKDWAGSACKEYEFKNGEFTFSLCDPAHGSSQGGKLSFWNCLITIDGNSFLIGISSEILCELLKNSTFINGTCKEKVYLGRINGNVGAFTSSMDLFKKGQEDEKIRNEKKTTTYVPGDFVYTLKEERIYLGEGYKYFELERSIYNHNLTYSQRRDKNTFTLDFKNADNKVFIYKEKCSWCSYINTTNNKGPRFVDKEKHEDIKDLKTAISDIAEERINYYIRSGRDKEYIDDSVFEEKVKALAYNSEKLTEESKKELLDKINDLAAEYNKKIIVL